MKIHVIGSTSYIAKRLLRRLDHRNDVICYARHGGPGVISLDLTDLNKSVFSQIDRGDFVVLLAAVSSPDECHIHYEASYQINVTGTKQFVEECLLRGARVLFFSSDVVVGACDVAHDETMPVNPIGEYGQMKYAIEQAFSSHPNFKAFRLSYVLSKEDKFIKFLQKSSQNNEVPDVFDALYRNVVYLEDLIDGIIALEKTFTQWDTPIFHICGPELLSRKDLAQIYQQVVDPKLHFSVSVPGAAFFEARPNTIAIKSRYFSQLLQREPTKIAKALALEFKKV